MSHHSPIKLPCGAVAVFDTGSGCAYRCTQCFSVVGSVSQPRSCVEASQKYEVMKAMGGKGWDYSLTSAELDEFDEW